MKDHLKLLILGPPRALLQRDNERANYELKEQKLVGTLIKACSLDPKVNSAAQRALEWKKPPTKHAGNFPMVMEEVSLTTKRQNVLLGREVA